MHRTATTSVGLIGSFLRSPPTPLDREALLARLKAISRAEGPNTQDGTSTQIVDFSKGCHLHSSDREPLSQQPVASFRRYISEVSSGILSYEAQDAAPKSTTTSSLIHLPQPALSFIILDLSVRQIQEGIWSPPLLCAVSWLTLGNDTNPIESKGWEQHYYRLYAFMYKM